MPDEDGHVVHYVIRRNMRTNTRFTLGLIGFFVAVNAAFIVARTLTDGIAQYRLMRIHGLANMEMLMFGGTAYIYWRLSNCIRSFFEVRIRDASTRWRIVCLHDVLRATVGLFLILAQIAFAFYFVWMGPEPNTFGYLSLISMALYIHVFIFLLITELIHGFGVALKKAGIAEAVYSWLERYRDTLAAFAVSISFLLVLIGVFTTSTPPIITEQVITLKDMNPGERPIHIALLSDIHIGPSVGRTRMEKVVNVTNRIHPDIIAISGDLADGFVRDYGEAAKPLCDLKAKYGVYFATGNHEYMHGNVEEWFEFLKACGIHVLHNKNRRFSLPNGTMVCMAGVDDLYTLRMNLVGHRMDPQKAVQGCEETDTLILLAHQPNAAKKILDDDTVNSKVDLVLSGHTHAGQMYMFVPIVYIANAFSHGLYTYGKFGTQVYVSAGVNFFGPPVKMFGTCEVIDIHVIPEM